MESNEKIQQFMKLLEENNRQGQAADLSQLLWYMDGMNRQYDAVRRELQEVKAQLAQEQQPVVKYVMQGVAATLENKVQRAQEMLDGLWNRIASCARSAVEGFKENGVAALDKAVAALGVKNTLEVLQEHISGMIDGTKRNIEKVENLGHELRSAGGHLKNAGRAVTGKETQAVDGGQEGRFQSVVLAPMRTVCKMLTRMNNATLAAIGGVEHLEQTADAARDHQAERAAEKSGKGFTKKPSIRQALRQNQAAAADKPAPDKEKKKEAEL